MTLYLFFFQIGEWLFNCVVICVACKRASTCCSTTSEWTFPFAGESHHMSKAKQMVIKNFVFDIADNIRRALLSIILLSHERSAGQMYSHECNLSALSILKLLQKVILGKQKSNLYNIVKSFVLFTLRLIASKWLFVRASDFQSMMDALFTKEHLVLCSLQTLNEQIFALLRSDNRWKDDFESLSTALLFTHAVLCYSVLFVCRRHA